VGAGPLSDDRYARLRRRLIEIIADRGIEDLAVLRAFDAVPRHRFLPAAVVHRAYEDVALPIGFGQTASQPSLQALYMQVLRLRPADRVLEIGTGSGFQTAVLSQLVAHVCSIERINELSARARAALDDLRVNNVALLVGDGTVGWSRFAPYEAILVGAAAPAIPPALIEQLAPGGRLLIPLGDRVEQQLTLVRKQGDAVETEEVTACTFVPLVGRFGWPAA
jgi:protein-L-isoaspartate(D-aspartate) O-methyltransferase